MRRKQKSENQKEAKKKGAERMRRFKENQEKPKRKKREKITEDDGTACWTYWERNVIGGDDEWQERFYYFDKNKKVERPME